MQLPDCATLSTMALNFLQALRHSNSLLSRLNSRLLQVLPKKRIKEATWFGAYESGNVRAAG